MLVEHYSEILQTAKKKRKGEGREGGERKERKREREERRRTVFVPSYAFKGASGCD